MMLKSSLFLRIPSSIGVKLMVVLRTWLVKKTHKEEKVPLTMDSVSMAKKVKKVVLLVALLMMVRVLLVVKAKKDTNMVVLRLDSILVRKVKKEITYQVMPSVAKKTVVQMMMVKKSTTFCSSRQRMQKKSMKLMQTLKKCVLMSWKSVLTMSLRLKTPKNTVMVSGRGSGLMPKSEKFLRNLITWVLQD